MRDKHSISYIVSLCGIMCGLALSMMFFLSMIPGFEYISPAVAGVLVWVVCERLGAKYGMICYIAVSLLSLLLSANYEATMMFVFLLGYYPIARQYIARLRLLPLVWVCKLAVYAAGAVLCYQVLIRLFGMNYLLEDMGKMGSYAPFILLGMGAAAFVLYDIFLGIFSPFYEKVLKPKIQRRMK